MLTENRPCVREGDQRIVKAFLRDAVPKNPAKGVTPLEPYTFTKLRFVKGNK